MWVGACVDDLGLITKIKEGHEAEIEAKYEKVLQGIRKIYKKREREAKEEKSEKAVRHGKLWGTESNGHEGWVASPVEQTVQLLRMTGELFSTGRASAKILASLIGSWNPVLLHRRPLMCLRDQTYDFINHIST